MEGLRERSRRNVPGVWNLGAGGCRGDVIGAEELEKNNSFFIQILFAVPAGREAWQAAMAGAAGKW